MKTRTLVGGGIGGAAAAGAANRLLVDRAGPLEPALKGTRDAYSWRGFEVGTVSAGDPERQDVVLLHGLHAAASGREFRGIFGSLAAGHHVVAPDLLGFGTSDRPAIRYTGALYESLLRDFLRDEVESPIVVASSLTASFAAAVAADVPNVSLLLVNPTDETGTRRRLARELLRSPGVGQGLFDLLVSRPALRYFDRELAYYDPGAVSDDVVDYQYRTAHQPNARFAPASFVGGFLEPSTPLTDSIAAFDGPVTLLWGRESRRPTLATGRSLAASTGTKLVVVDRTKLLPHDEHPDEFIDAVADALPGFEDE